jgi:hypothetical protein
MNDLLQSFIDWLKDPFGRKDLLKKHTQTISDIRATQAVVKETNEYYVAHGRGANAFTRALLGNPETKE